MTHSCKTWRVLWNINYHHQGYDYTGRLPATGYPVEMETKLNVRISHLYRILGCFCRVAKNVWLDGSLWHWKYATRVLEVIYSEFRRVVHSCLYNKYRLLHIKSLISFLFKSYNCKAIFPDQFGAWCQLKYTANSIGPIKLLQSLWLENPTVKWYEVKWYYFCLHIFTQ